MKLLFQGFSLLSVLLCTCGGMTAETPPSNDREIRHDLQVTLNPAEHRISVRDTITLPGRFLPAVNFALHKGLGPSSPTPGVAVLRVSHVNGPLPLESYRVTLPAGTSTFTLEYGGIIHHPLESLVAEQARGIRQTPGIISGEGVYLTGGSFWYPRFGEEVITFNLRVTLPSGWDAVSQGERTIHAKQADSVLVRWESPEPQDEIFLIAGRFTEYARQAGTILAMAFLRTPDEELAGKYLDATARYVALYGQLIGPYPYRKFALVENFWETGFGMPSFTLLGSKVIRLPFIINSSYPHEILHNWWGNGVFVDYEKGNWSEGLTAYLADHLLKEQQGEGAEYRRATLQKYADYVVSGRDFPLTAFRSRHSSPSEAVGYGKSLMFFHMLRLTLGDALFTAGLQDFYRTNKYRFASFDDLKTSLERVSGRSLQTEFLEWTTWTGAPQLALRNAAVKREADGYVLSAVIEQVQQGDPYLLRVPVAVTVEGGKRAYQTTLMMEAKRLEFTVSLPSRPLRLDIDPEFDLFRRLERDETPPAISQALGAEKMLILLPSSAGAGMLRAYRDFAANLSRSGPESVEIRPDSDIEKLPADRAVVVLGWENRFLDQVVSALHPYEVMTTERDIKLEGTPIPRKDRSLVLSARNRENSNLGLMFVASWRAEALPGLGRKLPHYHKYSYLVFEGDEPANAVKGRWPVTDSPMTVLLPGEGGLISRVAMGSPDPREPLAKLPQPFSADRMLRTISFLARNELMGRGFGSEGLDFAAEYIAGKFREAGLTPAGEGEGSYFQEWEDRGGEPEQKAMMRNVIGLIPGKKPDLSGQCVIVGAHYDHLGLGWPDARAGQRGKVHPGADDNASGVAVLIELAEVLGKTLKPDRIVLFVAFAGEEAGHKGSKYFVDHYKQYPVRDCMAMINLDAVGRLGKRKVLVLGAGSASEWVHIFRGAGFVTGVEIDAVAEGLDASDEKSFLQAGIPAVQLSTGPHLDYHRPSDTADKIDLAGLVKVASLAKEAVEYLSHRKEPLTVALSQSEPVPSSPKGTRKVSLGTIPDFAFTGAGMRLSGVVPGSPAESSGLREGDVIIRMNVTDIRGLKDLSDVLRSLTPGSMVSITFQREGKEMTVEAELKER